MNREAAVYDSFGNFFRFLIEEMKPRGPWITPFNVISIPVIITGVIILYFRFVYGLGAVTNYTQEVPWGLWKGLNVVTGVALAGGEGEEEGRGKGVAGAGGVDRVEVLLGDGGVEVVGHIGTEDEFAHRFALRRPGGGDGDQGGQGRQELLVLCSRRGR